MTTATICGPEHRNDQSMNHDGENHDRESGAGSGPK